VKTLIIVVIGAFVLALCLQSVAMGGAWMLHRGGRYDAEIAWLQGFGPFLPWERGLDAELDRLYRERVRRELEAGRLEGAVKAMRQARSRLKARGVTPDRELAAVGVETYTRAADHVERLGRLSKAADWDDTLFVFAIRAREPHHRYAALAAFMEGLDLRVRDGKPCEALARVEWARNGLGGEIPGMQENVSEDLAVQCRQARARGRR
jgi:hypothetical protein